MSAAVREPVSRAPEAASGLLRHASGPAAEHGRVLDGLLGAQRLLGNQGVQRLVQARLSVNPPGDRFEQEADRVADAVMRKPEPGKTVKVVEEDEEKDKVKRTAEPEERRAIRTSEDDDPALIVQTARADASAGPVPPGVESSINASRGGGEPLPSTLRSFFEPRFGRDFSNVRMHTGSNASGAARDLGAQAFTTGSDIFFGQGHYQPGSGEGQRLIAHELAHTVQQGTGQVARSVQRTNGETAPRQPPQLPPGPPPPLQLPAPGQTDATTIDLTTLPAETGRVNAQNEIQFLTIDIPGAKTEGERDALWGAAVPLRRKAGYDSNTRGTRQVPNWREALSPYTQLTSQGQTALTNVLATAAPVSGQGDQAIYRMHGRRGRMAIGRAADIHSEFVIPNWDRNGTDNDFDVDHIVETQLANYPNGIDWVDSERNYQLLQGGFNSSIGTRIDRVILEQVESFQRHVAGLYDVQRPGQGQRLRDERHEWLAGDGRDVMRRRTIRFDGYRGSLAPTTTPPERLWTKQQIRDGEHFRFLTSAVDQSATLPGLGALSRPVVYERRTGGVAKWFDWDPNATGPLPPVAGPAEELWLKPYRIRTKQFWTRNPAHPVLGHLTFWKPEDARWHAIEPFPQPVERIPGTEFAGYFDSNSIPMRAGAYRARLLSPARVVSVEVVPERGFLIRGVIVSDLPVIRDAGIQFEISGDDTRIFKRFDGPDISLPRPFQITQTSLELSYGTQSGFQISGRVDFAVERLGRGFLGAAASTATGFALEGGFDFDSRLFDPARVRIAYRDGAWSGSGELGIPAGKVRGIRSATITASYTEGRFEASGTAELDVPGIQRGTARVVYDEAQGLTIGGSFTLANNIPGIRSGSVEAEVRKPAGSEEWELSARGQAVPAIPGIDTSITVAYDRGALLIEGRAAYQRGMLSGTLHVGATNRAVDANGQPTGDPTDRLIAFGSGEVSARLAPWLQGTVGLRLLPNGEVVVSGALRLPEALELFPQRAWNRNIFSIGIDIPIIGVAFAGQRIGIFATVSGGLDLDASFGPGQLRELGLAITYNPSHEEQTHVTGGARVVVPAQAGLRLFIRGGLGAGIPIVSATAAVEVGARLGLEGEASAGVRIDWMPGRGLTLDAVGEVYVQPRLRFDVSAMVLVEADLLLTTIELYSRRWTLAQREFGSGLRFGVRFPVHYEEGQPFELSTDNLEWQIPEIEPGELLAGLFRELTA